MNIYTIININQWSGWATGPRGYRGRMWIAGVPWQSGDTRCQGPSGRPGAPGPRSVPRNTGPTDSKDSKDSNQLICNNQYIILRY